MKDNKQFILTIIAIISFIVYGIGIYLYITEEIGGEWENVAVNLAIQVAGPLIGVLIVIIIGSLILLFTYYFQKLEITNVFLCWFWILSLYQCAINTFLEIGGFSYGPINQFFIRIFPDFWYPAKEIFFLIISLVLTYVWVKNISKKDFTKLDILLIALAAFVLVGGTVISQLILMN